MILINLLPHREAARKRKREAFFAAVAGSAFYSKGRGENLLRFCFAKRDASLDTALERIAGSMRRT